MAKVGIITGILFSLIVVGYFVCTPSPPRQAFGPGPGMSTLIGVIVGSAVAGLLIEIILVRKLIQHLRVLYATKVASITGCIMGAVLSFPAALFLGVVIGGSFGGSWGSIIANKLGVNRMGISIGISSGIVVVMVILLFLGAFIGTLVGSIISKAFRLLIKKSGGVSA